MDIGEQSVISSHGCIDVSCIYGTIRTNPKLKGKEFKSNNTPEAKAAKKTHITATFANVANLTRDITRYTEEELERYEEFEENFAHIGTTTYTPPN